ncbi:hypothetical protein REPUB_Repub04eG0015600 [Reevesia pubescens]
MGKIFEINLENHHEEKLRFYYGGGALPGILRVSGDGGSWGFNCKSEGGNYFSISGSEWRNFARSRINDMVTLYNEGGEYTIRVR